MIVTVIETTEKNAELKDLEHERINNIPSQWRQPSVQLWRTEAKIMILTPSYDCSGLNGEASIRD